MAIKMIAVDMDGTFLDGQGQYDQPRFLKVLKQLQAREIKFVVASGNQMARLRDLFEPFYEQVTFVAENGAHIVDQGRIRQAHYMARDLLLEALAYFGSAARAYRLVVAGRQDAYILKDADLSQTFKNLYGTTSEEVIEAFFGQLVQLDSFEDLPADDFLKLNLMVDQAEAETVMANFNAAFADRLTAITSGFGSIDIIQAGLNKAWGLRQLMARWDIAASEIMAFGDGGNDLTMLALVGESYAMADADVEVKTIARHQAPANTEAGVLTVLEACLASDVA